MTGSGSPQRRAWRSPLAWLVLISVFGLGLIADLSLKTWTFNHVADEPVVIDREAIDAGTWRLPRHDPVPLVPKVLNLHLVPNFGAVFGLGQNRRWFFIIFTVAALLAATAVFGRWTAAGATAAHVAIGLIMAGGLGNLYDRVRFTLVRDFLHLFPEWRLPFGWHWPGGSNEIFPWVFNLADVMLLVGMGLLLLHMHTGERRRKASGALTTEPTEATEGI